MTGTFLEKDLMGDLMGAAIYIINVLIGVIQVVLVLRFILRLFGASPASPFVAWVLSVSQSFLYPFAGIFPAVPLGAGSVLEISTIVAIIAYAIFGYIIGLLIRALIPPITPL
jgi:hypothetical protein